MYNMNREPSGIPDAVQSSNAVNVCVLASTSSGNCTLIWNDSVAFLVDCGMSPRYTTQKLQLCGKSLEDITAVLVTHLHADHVHRNMLTQLARLNIPILAHKRVIKHLSKNRKHSGSLLPKNSVTLSLDDNPYQYGGAIIQCFPVTHDSVGGCYGFCIQGDSMSNPFKITIATDIGYPEDRLLNYFVNADIIIIEANHDEHLLATSSRPEWLKQRISNIGHLSNAQCANFIEKVLLHSTSIPRAIFLAHISQECNTNSLAIGTLTACIPSPVQIIETFQYKPSIIFSLPSGK